MVYLATNQARLAEIGQNVTLERGSLLGQKPHTKLTSLGQYRFEGLDSEVYLGLKESKEDIWTPKLRLVGELSLMRAIEESFPELVPQLPVVHGLIINDDGRDLGLITEDFSHGGKYDVNEVTDYHPNPAEKVVEKLRKMIANPDVNEDALYFDLSRACFLVNGEIKLGDLYGLRLFLKGEDFMDKFRIFDLEKELDKYTVTVNWEDT